MDKILDLRPTEEESCDSLVLKFYNDVIRKNTGKLWITLALKSMGVYAGIECYRNDYFLRITMIIDGYIESGIRSSLVNVK